jgi:thiol-disulfide isomerase/thioredoxin
MSNLITSPSFVKGGRNQYGALRGKRFILTPYARRLNCFSRCYTPWMFALQKPRKRKCTVFLASLTLLLYVIPAASLAPQASVVDLEGHPADPFRMAAGKIVVLLFVRTDCPIANRYAPAIQELSGRYANQAAFFLIYPIKSESPEQIRKHVADYGYHLPALRDPDLNLARFSEVTITPEAAVFSPVKKLIYHGRIDDWYVEFTRARRVPTTHELIDSLDAAIAGKPAPASFAPAVGCFIPGLT